MNTNDIFKLIIVSLLIMTCIIVVLITLGKKYIQSNLVIAQINNEENNLYDSKQRSIDREIPTIKPTNFVNEENTNSTIETANPELELVDEEIDYPKDIYYIKVNNEMNTVTVYTKDKNGEYTEPIKAMICSTGEATPQNCIYKITNKRWEWRLLFGDVYGYYTTQINGNILFHSVPYYEKSNDKLKYEEYDKLGTTASAGCVRLKVEDAKWIYEKCLEGTVVEFYNSSNPGPLGKPSTMKISEYEEYRNWDPTDLNENNPWNNML